MVKKSSPDFSQPIGANFVVALKTRDGEFARYVMAFGRSNGKEYMHHTDNLTEAKRFSRFTAEDVVEKVKEYRCTGRVEKVAADNSTHEPVDPEPKDSNRAIREFFVTR
jgi:hypothetical protein